jgi:hypothetical protein
VFGFGDPRGFGSRPTRDPKDPPPSAAKAAAIPSATFHFMPASNQRDRTSGGKTLTPCYGEDLRICLELVERGSRCRRRTDWISLGEAAKEIALADKSSRHGFEVREREARRRLWQAFWNLELSLPPRGGERSIWAPPEIGVGAKKRCEYQPAELGLVARLVSSAWQSLPGEPESSKRWTALAKKELHPHEHESVRKIFDGIEIPRTSLSRWRTRNAAGSHDNGYSKALYLFQHRDYSGPVKKAELFKEARKEDLLASEAALNRAYRDGVPVQARHHGGAPKGKKQRRADREPKRKNRRRSGSNR